MLWWCDTAGHEVDLKFIYLLFIYIRAWLQNVLFHLYNMPMVTIFNLLMKDTSHLLNIYRYI